MDLEITWIGVRKSWIEAVKPRVDQLEPLERLVNPLGQIQQSARAVLKSQRDFDQPNLSHPVSDSSKL